MWEALAHRLTNEQEEWWPLPQAVPAVAVPGGDAEGSKATEFCSLGLRFQLEEHKPHGVDGRGEMGE